MVHKRKVPEWLKKRAYYIIYWEKGTPRPLVHGEAFFNKKKAEDTEFMLRKSPKIRGTLMESQVFTYNEIFPRGKKNGA
jgi:hypothetical protein